MSTNKPSIGAAVLEIASNRYTILKLHCFDDKGALLLTLIMGCCSMKTHLLRSTFVATHLPKSSKKSTFSHKMGKKWGVCKKVEGGEVQKVHFSGVQKVHILGVRTPQNLSYKPVHILWYFYWHEMYLADILESVLMKKWVLFIRLINVGVVKYYPLDKYESSFLCILSNQPWSHIPWNKLAIIDIKVTAFWCQVWNLTN